MKRKKKRKKKKRERGREGERQEGAEKKLLEREVMGEKLEPRDNAKYLPTPLSTLLLSVLGERRGLTDHSDDNVKAAA